MNSRIGAMHAALSSGDSQLIRTANERVLAFALKQMAELRLIEHAYPQGIDLYQQSISYEDVPASHSRLALAFLQARHPDDALSEAEKVIYSDPNNAIAWRIEGNAWMQRRDYKKAEEALAHSLKLKGDVATAYQLAMAFLNDKQKDKADLVFKDILSNLSDSAEVRLSIGRAYRDADYTDDAEREFRKAISLNPDLPYAHYYLALLLLIRNEWFPTPETRTLIDAELKINPHEYVANFLAGMFASGDKRLDDSDRYLSIAAKGFPEWAEVPLYLGLNAYSRSDYKSAETLLQKAIDLTGKDESRGDYQIRRAYIALGRIMLATGRKQESEKYFQKSRELLQDALAFSQQSVAKFISAQGGEVGMGAVAPLLDKKDQQEQGPDVTFADPSAPIAASDLAQSGLSDEERNAARQEEEYLRKILGSSFNDIGSSEARQGEFAAALKDFRQAERWNPNIPGLARNLGIAAFRVQEYRDSARTLAGVVASNADDRAARVMLGISQYMISAYPEAAKTLAPMSSAARNDAAVGLPLAVSLAKTGEYTTSADILAGIEQQPLAPDTLFLVGQTWMEIQNYDHAIEILHRALTLNPSLPKAHYAAGVAAIHAGRPADAEREFIAELSLNPQDVDAEYNLAYAYLLDSQRDKALPLLSKVLTTNPHHADANYQFGKLLMDEGKSEAAIPYLEAAERAGPEKDYVHYQLQAAYRKESRLQDADRELQLYKEIKSRNRELSTPRPQAVR